LIAIIAGTKQDMKQKTALQAAIVSTHAHLIGEL